MLQNFVGKDFLSGLGTVKLDVNSGGTTLGDVRRGLNGDVALNFENGAIKGFNLGQIIRKGQSALRGESFSNTEPEQTDFSTIGFAAKIVNGVLQSDQLNAQSPLFRLAGKGQIDLVNDYVRSFAEDKAWLDVINGNAALMTPEGTPNGSLFRFDRVHLNKKGYARWAQILRPTLLEHWRQQLH